MPKNKPDGYFKELLLLLIGGGITFIGILSMGYFNSNVDISLLTEKVSNLELSASRSESSVERMRVLMVALHPDERNNPNLMPVAAKIGSLSIDDYNILRGQFLKQDSGWIGLPTSFATLPTTVQVVLDKNSISMEDIQIYASAVNSPIPVMFRSQRQQ